jgi:hypothetical protein
VLSTTVRTRLRAAGLGPAGKRRGMTWREFIRTHRHSLLVVDFFTVETIWLQRLYVLCFIELGSRRVRLASCTSNPSSAWVTQQARQLTWTLSERPESIRFRFAIGTRNSQAALTRCSAVTGLRSVARRFAPCKPTVWRNGSCGPSAPNVSIMGRTSVPARPFGFVP